jgi:hypothetical protein
MKSGGFLIRRLGRFSRLKNEEAHAKAQRSKGRKERDFYSSWYLGVSLLNLPNLPNLRIIPLNRSIHG